MDRRMFVVQSACAFAAIASAGCASLAAVRVTPDDGRVRLSPTAHPSLAQPGGWLKVQPESWSTPLYVLALENGEYAALSPICTHRGCTVNVAGARLVCPCHGSTYDREGKVLRGPAERALQRFPAHVTTSGEVIVEIGGQA